MVSDEPVLVFHSRDERGTRSIWATFLDDGSLRIQGQDLGASVAVFGPGLTEYEWDWTLSAADVPRAVQVFGGDPGADLIALLRQWTRASKGRDPGQHLKDAGLELGFWSRVGD